MCHDFRTNSDKLNSNDRKSPTTTAWENIIPKATSEVTVLLSEQIIYLTDISPTATGHLNLPPNSGTTLAIKSVVNHSTQLVGSQRHFICRTTQAVNVHFSHASGVFSWT